MSKDRRATLVFDRKGQYEPWPEECFVKVTSQARKEPVIYKLGERSIRLNKTKMVGSGKSGGCAITDTRPRSSRPKICDVVSK